MGFKTNPLNKLIIGVKNLITNYEEVEKRLNIDFDIDGIVYKVNDFALQKRLGYVVQRDGRLHINFLLIKLFQNFRYIYSN